MSWLEHFLLQNRKFFLFFLFIIFFVPHTAHAQQQSNEVEVLRYDGLEDGELRYGSIGTFTYINIPLLDGDMQNFNINLKISKNKDLKNDFQIITLEMDVANKNCSKVKAIPADSVFIGIKEPTCDIEETIDGTMLIHITAYINSSRISVDLNQLPQTFWVGAEGQFGDKTKIYKPFSFKLIPRSTDNTEKTKNNTLKLEFSGGETMNHPEILKGNTNILGNLNPENLKGKSFYEKENNDSPPVIITLSGCTSGASFYWYQKKPICNSEGKDCKFSPSTKPVGSRTNIFPVSDTSNTITIEERFDVKDEPTIFTMQAKCADGREIFEPFLIVPRQEGKGSEFILVPSEIEANKEWSMTLGGLRSSADDLLSNVGACYFFQLIQKNDDGSITYIQNENPDQKRNDCGTLPVIGDGIDKKYDETFPYYLASEHWDPESVINMPPLAKGHYEVRLYLAQRGSLNDNNVANLIFCVGGGIGCINEENSSPVILPPPNPCPEENQNENGTCNQVSTAIGNISVEPSMFISNLLRVLLSVSGGIILLLIIRSGYQLITSQGNPEKITEAKDRITSAIIGLLFIIFSMVILEVIGVNILNIPGFSS
jgi:hypothetical protein